MKFVSIIMILPLMHMMVTDLRRYRISLFVLLLTIILGGIRFFQRQAANAMEIFIINFLLITFLSGIITLFIWLKAGKIQNPFKNSIGVGDIGILILMACSFSPANFILFLVTSSITGIIYWGFLKLFKSTSDNQVPFAGIASGLLIVVIIAEHFTHFSPFVDFI